MNNTRNLLALFAIASLVIAACANSATTMKDNAPLTADEIYAGVHCGGAGSAPNAAWITSQAAMQDQYDNMAKTLGMSQPEMPNVDFATEGVLVVRMGRQLTAGYALSLSESNVELKDGDAVVKVSRIEPAEGSIQAQVLTSPCLMVKLPAKGFSRVRVVDQHDREFTSVTVLKKLSG